MSSKAIPLPDDPRRSLAIVPAGPPPFADSTQRPEEEPSDKSLRGRAFLFTFPAPEVVLPSRAERASQRKLLPEDVGKEGLRDAILAAFPRANPIRKLVVAQEYHARRSPFRELDVGKGHYPRLAHLHAAGSAASAFAHTPIEEHLARAGIRGRMSKGTFLSKAEYLLLPGAGKSPDDLDQTPLFYGDVSAREFEVADEDEGRCKKRIKRADVVVLTETILENKLYDVSAVRAFARDAMQKGTPAGKALYKYVFETSNIEERVRDIVATWELGAEDTMLITAQMSYPLRSFGITGLPELGPWIDGGFKNLVLVISGLPGCGKSRLAVALCGQLAGWPVAFARTAEEYRDGCRASQYTSVVFDEFASEIRQWVTTNKVDGVKSLLDNELRGSLPARNRNATVLPGRPRVVVVQVPLAIVCAGIGHEDFDAIKRRCVEVRVDRDIRLRGGQAVSSAS
jgi:hypothetical protein